MLRRLAVKFDVLKEEDFSNPESVSTYDLIFVPHAIHLSESTILVLNEVIQGKTRLLVSDLTNLPNSLLGVNSKEPYIPQSYVFLKNFSLFPEQPCLISPPNYTIYRTDAAQGAESLSPLFELLESREEALIKGDGVIASKQGMFLPFPFFEFVGALLQGHLDIQPVLSLLGDLRYFYLDRMALFLKELVSQYVWQGFCRTRIRVWGKHDQAMILRHDTDNSRDTTYLDFEKEKQIPATYPILLDKNGSFWLQRTAGNPFLEQAFHFPSNRCKAFRFFPTFPAKPDKRRITRKGLERQLARARKNFKPPFTTAHRHFAFLYYPESIEAMDFAYTRIPDLTGLGTMFRFVSYRYFFSPQVSSRKKVVIEQPDTGITLWSPFHMQISSLEKFHPLRGWDCSAFVEPDPVMTDLIFENSSLLPGGMYTLIFHPAHARGGPFHPGGNFEWYEYAVKKAGKENWLVTTIRDAYQKISEWEDLKLCVEEEKIQVQNAGLARAEDVVVESDGIKFHLGAILPNETRNLVREKAHDIKGD